MLHTDDITPPKKQKVNMSKDLSISQSVSQPVSAAVCVVFVFLSDDFYTFEKVVELEE